MKAWKEQEREKEIFPFLYPIFQKKHLFGSCAAEKLPFQQASKKSLFPPTTTITTPNRTLMEEEC